jgi:hypothetical protein
VASTKKIMSTTKPVPEICKLAGLKFEEASAGAHVAPSSSDPGGYWLKDGTVALALEHFIDQMDPDVGHRIQTLANLHRKAQALRQEREEAQAEARKQAEADRQKREAELRQKQEAELRRTIRMANPGISDKEVEDLLPEMRREAQKQRVKAVLIQQQRNAGRKF